jgi:hypothetical protein
MRSASVQAFRSRLLVAPVAESREHDQSDDRERDPHDHGDGHASLITRFLWRRPLGAVTPVAYVGVFRSPFSPWITIFPAQCGYCSRNFAAAAWTDAKVVAQAGTPGKSTS